ncbi:hypothetical protein [Streptomyces sp. NPDC002057]|uniref:hypothetical protein n=1 Tax=Streptomyces sp. NPDC002057 TaxID=3154664 RepID=UPI00333387D0
MTTKDQEILDKISELKDALLKDRPNKDPKEAKLSELKEHLVNQAPKLVTEDWFKTQFTAEYFKKIDDMHQELVKAKKTEWMEAMGLEGFASAVEKFHEGSVWTPVYLLSAFIGLAIPAFLVVLAMNLKEWQRNAQQAIATRLLGRGPEPRIIATRENSLRPGFQSRTDVNRREQAAAGGMAAIPETANFEPLRAQLRLLNPLLETFNQHAPGFISNFRKLPTESKATKAAKGVKAVAEAVAGVNHQAMPLVASGMGKINGAVRNSDPKKTDAFAKAIGKLKIAMTGLEVDRVPKAATLGQAADNAKRLADNSVTLATKMREMAATIREVNQQINGPAPA